MKYTFWSEVCGAISLVICFIMMILLVGCL